MEFDFKKKLKDFYKLYSIKKDEEIKRKIAQSNFKSVFVILHFLFAFGVINLFFVILKYANDLFSYHASVLYFGLLVCISFSDLIFYIIIKFILHSKNIILLNMPLYFAFVAIYMVILFRTASYADILSGMLLICSVSLVVLIFLNVNPVLFICINSVPFIIEGYLIIKLGNTTALTSIILLFLVLCVLAFYKRLSVINSIKSTTLLEDQKKNLEQAYSKQSAEVELQAIELIHQNRKLMKIQDETIISLSNLVENRDSDTGGHVKRTSKYVNVLANAAFHKKMYPDIINERYIELVTKAAPLHDIGKIVVSDAILKKPGKLTDEEFEEIKRHSSEGGNIVQEVLGVSDDKEYVQIACDIAMYHHEKWNGKGYPTGLSEENIPLSARFMAVADVYDALVSKRCYKESMTYDEAVEIIKSSNGSHFDPQLVELFLENAKEFEEIAKRYTD